MGSTQYMAGATPATIIWVQIAVAAVTTTQIMTGLPALQTPSY